ncbi:MAG: hypothetical protein AAFY98_05435 [Verrucomicrobiota bacterium]
MEPYQLLVEGKTCVNLSHHQRWCFKGPDAERYLNGQLTQKIEGMEEMTSLHSAICNAKGKLEGDCNISKIHGEYWVDWVEELGESVRNRLEKYIITDDVEVEELSLYRLYFIAHTEFSVMHIGSIAVPSYRYGLKGYDLWLPKGALPPVLLTEPSLWQAVRICHGWPLATVDYTENYLAAEVFQRDRTLHYQKGCYVGQEVLNRIRTRGKVNRMIKLIECNEPVRAKLPPYDLHVGDQVVGRVTSCANYTKDKKLRAIATIESKHLEDDFVDGANNHWHVKEIS